VALSVCSSFPAGGIAVVFGAKGGIGNALASRLSADPRFAGVVRFSRSSSPAIDLLSEASLRDAVAFAAALGDLRLIVNATGFLHDETQRPEKSWRENSAYPKNGCDNSNTELFRSSGTL